MILSNVHSSFLVRGIHDDRSGHDRFSRVHMKYNYIIHNNYTQYTSLFFILFK